VTASLPHNLIIVGARPAPPAPPVKKKRAPDLARGPLLDPFSR
jgi:hypothetical protein